MKPIIRILAIPALAMAFLSTAQANPPGKGIPGPLTTNRETQVAQTPAAKPTTCADCVANKHSGTCPTDARMNCNGCKTRVETAAGGPRGKSNTSLQAKCVTPAGKKCNM